MMKPFIRCGLCAAGWFAACSAAAAPLANLPAGLYRESGATETTYSGGSTPLQPRLSEGNPVREVCVPADNSARYAEQLRRFPQALSA